MKKNQQNNKSRSAIAAVLAIAILVSGTFAWQAFDQEALNETQGDASNPGARLHDDFDGENKDVYVENYMTIEEGGSPVYARVRLDEYMEYGTGAGVIDEDKNRDNDMVILEGDLPKYSSTLQPLTPDIYNEDTWYTYEYNPQAVAPVSEEESIRDYRDLEFGGTTIYMPTFNKNNRSEESDINGTLEGGTGDRFTKKQFEDYKEYSQEEPKVEDEHYYWDGSTEIPTYYDTDGTTELSVDTGVDYYNVIGATHTAQSTLGYDNTPQSVKDIAVDEGIITMEQWETLSYEDKVGDYWVYDVDGWAYWANPIMPQTATNLLLTGIETLDNPLGTQVYYAVNVVSEFASIGDFGDQNGATPAEQGMYADITQDGIILLDRIAAATSFSFTFTDEEGNIIENTSIDVEPEETISYGVLVTIPAATLEEGAVTWSLLDEAGAPVAGYESTLEAGEPATLEGKTGTWNTVDFTPTQAMLGNTYTIQATSVTDDTQSFSFTVHVTQEESDDQDELEETEEIE